MLFDLATMQETRLVFVTSKRPRNRQVFMFLPISVFST